MARPRDPGLSYFPLDVDFFSDAKIRILKARFGPDGITLYVYLLCRIYRHGYYMEWNEDTEYITADELNMSCEKVKQVLRFLLERSLFNNTLFQSDTILTGAGIQNRYQEAVEAKARKNPIIVNKDYWLLSMAETKPWLKVVDHKGCSENNTSYSGNNGDNSGNNDTKQNKTNQNKTNEYTRARENDKDDDMKHLFEEFWEAYPKKVAADAAYQVWCRRSPDRALTDKMLSVLSRQKKTMQWKANGGQFIPNPATWLDQGRWADDPSTYTSGPDHRDRKRSWGRSDNVGNFREREYSDDFYEGLVTRIEDIHLDKAL